MNRLLCLIKKPEQYIKSMNSLQHFAKQVYEFNLITHLVQSRRKHIFFLNDLGSPSD